MLGSVLWALVLGLLTYLYVFRGQQADQGRQSAAAAAAGAASAEGAGQSEGAQAPDDAVVASTKTVKISFPTRQLPAFEFPECQGGVVSLDSLKGRRWLASFVFTRCVTTCPVITREISLLHKRVAQSNPDFVFVTFSVDSSYDTAEVLRKYGETFQADPVRWKFLTGD
ncbi:MAG: SCO family protein, partial [Planctomycetaceae bacterium]